MLAALLELDPAACPQLDEVLVSSLSEGQSAMAVLELKVDYGFLQLTGMMFEACLTLLDPQETADYLASEAELEELGEFPEVYTLGDADNPSVTYLPE